MSAVEKWPELLRAYNLLVGEGTNLREEPASWR